jgi:uracil-DNA glycosylase
MNIELIDQTYDYQNTSLIDLVPQNEWFDFFKSQEKELNEINNYLKNEFNDEKQIFPMIENVFRIFYMLPPSKIKCVILGLSPYDSIDKKTNLNNATGIAFSIPKKRKLNPSVRNILKEINECKFKVDMKDGNLEKLVKQGVFLYNVSLTVLKGKPSSHIKLYDRFTRNVMEYLDKLDIPFLLWGNIAQVYKKNITSSIIECSHPSPFSNTKTSSPFTGSKCFSKANKILKKKGKEEINWNTV